MTDFAPLLRPDRGEPASSITLVDKASAPDWLARQAPPRRALLDAMHFDGKSPHRFALLAGANVGFDIVA